MLISSQPFKRTLLLSATLLSLAVPFSVNAHDHDDSDKEPEKPKQIILVIADGMGHPFVSAYRYFKDGRNHTMAADVEQTIFDRYLVGSASTYPADDTLVTDSAASATALATGVKTYNGAISVDADGNPIPTIMHKARDLGWQTAAIATTRVTHATPASFFTHVPSRRMEDEIADQFAVVDDNGLPMFDLLLGSGRKHFVLEDENGNRVSHLRTLNNRGVRVVESYEQLQTQQRLPLLGLFHDDAFPFVIDDQKRLELMAREGLRLLGNSEKPFVLMIEASMVDWCGHANDIACAMHEMAELDDLMLFLEEYAEGRDDTQIILTADHSTGGLTLGADGDYKFRAGDIHNVGRSLRVMATELNDMPAVDWDAYIDEYLPFTLTTEHQTALTDVAASTSERRRAEIQAILIDIVRFHTGAGWTTGGHTGEDVPVIAIGPWSENFKGAQDHIDIATQLIDWVQN
ncbi:alkaline phosphatase [Aliidiomarina iranensis]|uniref:Alkaline phosphatase n=1 Tax=Aliidiomarina iranensis TaxID=1434071 RepID=A0A432W377_9GAMM|nr:alkaline phosphatase [Aliidiomarina iranensis]RUO23649.1 alkaline phosphatase [Aliidiomarina iranensis]